jgi:L-threonylcarbamoyladenylate synthase
MKILKSEKRTEIINQVAEAIKEGKTVAIPFDTVYGLIANPYIAESIDKLYRIKGRDFSKPLALIFDSLERVKSVLLISDNDVALLKGKIPGRYTFLTNFEQKAKEGFAPQYQKLEKIGFRVPKSRLVRGIVSRFEAPFAATSANLSGSDNCWSADDFLFQIKDQPERPDLVIDFGSITKNKPSKIIDLTMGRIIRK